MFTRLKLLHVLKAYLSPHPPSSTSCAVSALRMVEWMTTYPTPRFTKCLPLHKGGKTNPSMTEHVETSSVIFLSLFFEEINAFVFREETSPWEATLFTASDDSAGGCMNNLESVPSLLSIGKWETPKVCFSPRAHPKFKRCPESNTRQTGAIREVIQPFRPLNADVSICPFLHVFKKQLEPSPTFQ